MRHEFFSDLEAELNRRTTQIEKEWVYHANWLNAIEGIAYDFGMDQYFPTFVRLLYSQQKFQVVVSVNGERDIVYEGDDRNTAIAFAIAKAVQVENEWIPNDVETGFEHDGLWITDRTKSPCGRFDLTAEESDKLYGKETNNG
jgi:hypothetical protein